MKINIEIDVTPEEARTFFGLPDVQSFQNKMMQQFADRIEDSAEQSEEFMRNMFKNAMEPWQIFSQIISGQAGKSRD
ncbi:MAG: DUF6489 family protein [Pseudomonadota bacterium]